MLINPKISLKSWVMYQQVGSECPLPIHNPPTSLSLRYATLTVSRTLLSSTVCEGMRGVGGALAFPSRNLGVWRWRIQKPRSAAPMAPPVHPFLEDARMAKWKEVVLKVKILPTIIKCKSPAVELAQMLGGKRGRFDTVLIVNKDAKDTVEAHFFHHYPLWW